MTNLIVAQMGFLAISNPFIIGHSVSQDAHLQVLHAFVSKITETRNSSYRVLSFGPVLS